MNYIWELAINAYTRNIDPDTIFYRYGRPFSGYMELSFVDMNETGVLPEVDINPYYRYYRIFRELFEPNVDENPELIEVVHDLTIHHLKDIDILMGMNKREYYIEFAINDMKSGYYGDFVKEKINIFTRGEQKILANNLLGLHETAECIFSLRDTVSRVFTNSYILANVDDKDIIVLYLRTKETKERRDKIELIKYLFTPFKYEVEVYWEYIFGIIDVDELMIIDRILLY